jgi:hypothetical protein
VGLRAVSVGRRHVLLKQSKHWIRREELEARINEALDHPVPLYPEPEAKENTILHGYIPDGVREPVPQAPAPDFRGGGFQREYTPSGLQEDRPRREYAPSGFREGGPRREYPPRETER